MLPMIAGLVFVPLLLHGLGTARYGFLSLVWVLIGYFSLFDLGLSRALTQRVALLGAREDSHQLRTAVATGMLLICALSVVSVPLLFACKGLLIDNVVRSSVELTGEASRAFPWIVIGVPVVILAAGVRGILEGEHRFAEVNIVRTPAGVMMFAGPWLAMRISPTLESVTLAVLIVRALQLLGFVWQAWPLLSASLKLRIFDRAEVRMLFGFGLWMTVSNIISPLLVYLDRFVIAHFGNLSDVSYYSTPFDLLSRSLFLSSAIGGVMFPAISAALARAPHDVPRLVRQNYMMLVMFFLPPLSLVVLLAKPALTLWLGADFAARSAQIMQVLAVGIFVNAMTSVATSQLHAIRRADLTAKCHLVELPIYLAALAFLVQHYGILGAALAWLGRVSLDLVLLTSLAQWQYRRIVHAPLVHATTTG
jgi:O-antigen/teichoic acid export membrane protein